MSADRIEAVSILSHNESRGVCEAAFEQIPGGDPPAGDTLCGAGCRGDPHLPGVIDAGSPGIGTGRRGVHSA